MLRVLNISGVIPSGGLKRKYAWKDFDAKCRRITEFFRRLLCRTVELVKPPIKVLSVVFFCGCRPHDGDQPLIVAIQNVGRKSTIGARRTHLSSASLFAQPTLSRADSQSVKWRRSNECRTLIEQFIFQIRRYFMTSQILVELIVQLIL